MATANAQLPSSKWLPVGSWGLGVGYFLAHLLVLAPSLEDIDSINFALGLREFNPAEHQPHPPGYPIYIAIGRLFLWVITSVRPALARVPAEALALSLMSALAGAVAIAFAWRVFYVLSDSRRTATWATILLAVCPLFWMTGVRPMSDMPGLAMALAAQALVLDRRVKAGAFLSGLALGVRTQTLWLTAPLLALTLYRERGDQQQRNRLSIVLLAAAGALCWAVPLVYATGGFSAYLDALGGQAGEDFAFVDMLWANPTPRRLAFGLVHSLIWPWESVPLAAVVLAISVLGGLLLLLRNRPALLHFVVLFVPYAAFHLVFQETVTVRYALPLVPAVSFLAASALALAGPAMNVVATPLAVASLIVAVPATVAYNRDPHPAFRAMGDVARRASVDRPSLITSHFELRRPIRASDLAAQEVVFAPLQREWMELVNYWAKGGTGVAWFLANPRRTDLDLIDRHSRRDVVRYRWSVEGRRELSGTRPFGVDWYRLRPPAWFLAEGWSLTAETGGVARATGTSPDQRPIVAFVRQHAGPMNLVVGGLHLGPAGTGPARFEMALDDVVIDRWTLTREEGTFLRFLELPAGVAKDAGDYARLTIRSEPAQVPTAVTQFDAQPAARPIFGFGSGWYEDEFDAQTGLRWRWASDRAVLRVRGAAEPLRVHLSGESPLNYFDAPATFTLSAGGRQIAQLQPAADWEWSVIVPAEAVVASNGDIVIATTRTFVPAESGRSPDTRRLGVRTFAVDIATAR